MKRPPSEATRKVRQENTRASRTGPQSLISDSNPSQTSVGTSRPPSHRHDVDDDDARPLPMAQRSGAATRHQSGPEFSPDYEPTSATRKAAKEKKTTIRQSGGTSDKAAHGAHKDVDQKVAARASRYCDAGAVLAVPSLKQEPRKKILQENEQAELSPDNTFVHQSKRKKRANSGGKKSKDSKKDSGNFAPEPTFVNLSLEASAPAAAESISTFQPRPPRSEVVVGAIAVDGVDGPSEDYDFDDQFSEAMPSEAEATSSLPVARMADDANKEYLDDLGQAQPLSPEDLARQGWKGWIRQHKLCAAVAVLVMIGAIVGGSVGATFGGSPPEAPTFAPTFMPTAAPTLLGFEEIVDTLITLTPYSLLTDPSTPQNAAVTWLMREDQFDIDFGNAPKLLQRYALATIYFATVGFNWTRQIPFLTNQDDCFWNAEENGIFFGLGECNVEGLATKLQLSRSGLQGTLPEEIAGMPFLDEFGAAESNLTGTLPKVVAKLTDLSSIHFYKSGVTGALPSDIGNLRKLTHLALQTNNLSGTVPSSLYSLSDLENLYLSENRLSGTLSTEVGNLVSLKQFWLSSNQLSGSVPSSVSRLTNLVNVLLDDNDFTGGMENFCASNISLAVFQADCYADGTLVQTPKVECPCCTACCFYDGSFNGCIPNSGIFAT